MLYRNFSTQEQLDAEYNPVATIGAENIGPIVSRHFAESARVRATLSCRENVPYGPTNAEFVDIYPAKRQGAPIHVFFHGGYWIAFGSKEHAFVAEPFYRHDITT